MMWYRISDPKLGRLLADALLENRKNTFAGVEALRETKSDGVENPITVAIDIQALAKSGKRGERELGIIMEMLAEIRAQLAGLQPSTQPSLLAALAGLPPTSRGAMNVSLGDALASDPHNYFDTAVAMEALRRIASELEAQKSRPDQNKT